jgi:hypothetical protein
VEIAVATTIVVGRNRRTGHRRDEVKTKSK